ncbi:MAG: CDP-glucose 4,6-dehydratase, partial [Planctomycetes bacterium]|nr:CDP-glucose 4,6-dehydratase [Planctomycetota bacterium]
KTVLLTGHTGFKGSWLALWLATLGARVHGLALEPDTAPSLFDELGLERDVDHCIADIRDPAAVRRRVAAVRPEIVFHLAAQPLVRRSYAEPVLTWQTNVMGTVHLLDALRDLDRHCAVVVVTTDKVYENREWVHAYRETDRLGGHDPYSSSKAACELAVASWRNSFFTDESSIRVATARAGNVIGGGDWSEDRIVPDLAKAIAARKPLVVRNPDSIRPWQHVLDPLSGYMQLAERLFTSDDPQYQSAFNFGPDASGARTVRDLVDLAFSTWPGTLEAPPAGPAHHEAQLLTLANTKASTVLGWTPTWGFDEAVGATVNWYRAHHQGATARELAASDIQRFVAESR